MILPQANVVNLNLNDAVAATIQAGQFHIWPIRTVDEGIALLTGLPAGKRQADGSFPENTVHHLVEKRLTHLAKGLKEYSKEDEEGDPEEEKGGRTEE